MRRLILPFLATLALLLAACSAATPTPAVTPTPDRPTAEPGGDVTRIDQQGAVTVEITPLNLGSSSDDIKFEVSLNTHSVDLSMDLASLSTLTTDTGITVQAIQWEAPSGGHHVSGQLIFPATKDGKSILEDASKLTLAILNVDAASRVFEWELK